MSNKKENLRELIEKFMDAQKAQMYIEDIESGEQLLSDHPAPEPDDMLIANIKANIALKALPQKTVTFKKRVYEALAVAASIAIIVIISLNPLPNNKSYSVPEGFWTGKWLEDDIREWVIEPNEGVNRNYWTSWNDPKQP